MKRIAHLLVITAIVLLNENANAAVNDLTSINFGEFYSGFAAEQGLKDEWDPTGKSQKGEITLKYAEGVNFSWTSSGYDDAQGKVRSAFGEGNNDKLMNSFIYATGKESYDLIFSKLDPNASYDLYVYSQDLNKEDLNKEDLNKDNALKGNNGEILSVAVNGKKFGTTANTDVATSKFILGQNYLTGKVETDDSGNLKISYSSGVSDKRAVINGLQLYQLTSTPPLIPIDTNQNGAPPAPVPEPASIVLMGVGGLIAARRLKKQQCSQQ